MSWRDEQDDGVTDLQNNVLALLEDAGIPQEVCDQIILILWRYENDSVPSAAQLKRVHETTTAMPDESWAIRAHIALAEEREARQCR